MKIKGIIDFSLGNFLCLRGFAPMGVLQDISKSDDIQRVPRNERLREIEDFLKKGEFIFFPEVILCVSLNEKVEDSMEVNAFFQNVKMGVASRTLKFSNGLRISSLVRQSKKHEDIRAVQFFQIATVDFDETKGPIFSRVDGNHRLEAAKKTDTLIRERVTPFCVVFCRNNVEFCRFSRALFHIINYKQVPLLKEHNLKIILENPDLFPDDLLKTDPSFGWPYYLARQLNNKVDYDLLPNLKAFIKDETRSFLVDQLSLLIGEKILGENENAIKRFKEALVRVNSQIDAHIELKDSTNCGLVAAMVYYELQHSSPIYSFLNWVISNHLHLINQSSSADFIQIFNQVLESRRRTIFVAMPFKQDITENHYSIIERVCKEITSKYSLKPSLKVQRVDWFQDGTSYEINDKIIDLICDCGLLIGNLTLCNPNVYHEIGFVMGKAKAEGKDTADTLLFLDESVPKAKDKFVGFNLRGTKYIAFTKTEDFASQLHENLERFFKLKN